MKNPTDPTRLICQPKTFSPCNDKRGAKTIFLIRQSAGGVGVGVDDAIPNFHSQNEINDRREMDDSFHVPGHFRCLWTLFINSS